MADQKIGYESDRVWIMAETLAGGWRMFQVAKEQDLVGTFPVRMYTSLVVIPPAPGQKPAVDSMKCLPANCGVVDEGGEVFINANAFIAFVATDNDQLIECVLKRWIEQRITPASEAMAKQQAKLHDATNRFRDGGVIERP